MTSSIKSISSRDNPLFKELLKLVGSARQRKKTGQTLLDGIHLVQAYLAAGSRPLHVLVTQAALQDDEIMSLLGRISKGSARAEPVEAHSPFDTLRANGHKYSVPLTQLDDSLFAELTELKTPSGIIALIEQPQPEISVAQSRFALLLEDIQDPGNLGSMLRSAAAAGCDAVFLSKGCADAWSPKVLRAGMGGHFALSIHESMDLPAVAASFQGVLLAASPKAGTSLYDCDLRGKLAFALGNEGAGLSLGLQEAAGRCFTIPMPGKVESLNVAAAAAVCLFEAARQRGVDGVL